MRQTRVIRNTVRQEHLSFIDEVESHFEEDYTASKLSAMKE